MEKKMYETPEMEEVLLNVEDGLLTSDTSGSSTGGCARTGAPSAGEYEEED